MRNQTERLYLFNPFNLKSWENQQIKDQLDILIDKYDEDADTMSGLALNIENLANQNVLIGEMISRLTEEHICMKARLEANENIAIVTCRSNWECEGKPPAMKFFEAQAAALYEDDRKELAKKESDLKRFKIAYDAIGEKINAIKKRMEAIKYEITGGLN
ncbi:hypothetical protein [uncultured Dubosiella sp.]|uniref:hypothetical protein n=1 Tax=uncultured Dubosiella sp. TaxID=1937011 RepID=UPI002613592E|nr:hypothetical protein [uncultured Dubosiella sp.]